MPPQASTFFDPADFQPPKGESSSFFEEDVKPKTPVFTNAADIARYTAEHPTEFEKSQSVDKNGLATSMTPWTDVAKGLGESALSTVAPISSALNKIPYIGETLAPKAGVAAMRNLATPRTPGEKLGATEGNVIQTAAVPWGRLAEGAKALPFVRPAAQFVESTITPALRATPFIGKAFEAAEGAPTAMKAATRGAVSGAGYGAARGLYHRDPKEAAEGALYGAGIGALTGGGAYGLRHFAEENPTQGAFKFPHIEANVNPEVEVKPEAPKVTTMPSIRRGPGEIAPERIEQPPEARIPAIAPSGSFELPGGGKLQRAPLALPPGEMPKLSADPVQRMGELIEQGSGWQPLKPDVPLREQNFGGKMTFRKPPEAENPDIGAGRMVKAEPGGSKPSYLPSLVNENVGREFGAGPLEPGKPLREQFEPNPNAPPSKQEGLEQKYPDKAIRQMVHANGEEIVDRVGDDTELLRAVHDLKNPDVRQALINSGEDMGQTSIGNRKATGNQITRQEAFKKLLAKGYSPEEIVRLSKQTESEAKPGPARAETRKEESGAAD